MTYNDMTNEQNASPKEGGEWEKRLDERMQDWMEGGENWSDQKRLIIGHVKLLLSLTRDKTLDEAIGVVEQERLTNCATEGTDAEIDTAYKNAINDVLSALRSLKGRGDKKG